jgi:hypothetical protein
MVVADKPVTGDGGDMLVRATTTATCLEAEQDSVTSIRPNPRQHLMCKVRMNLKQVMDTLVTWKTWGA